MAEKAEKKPAEAPAAGKKESAKPGPGAAAAAETPKPSGGGIKALLAKTPVLVGGVMILEAVILFTGIKMFGGGAKKAEGADLTIQKTDTDSSGAPIKSDLVEVKLLDGRFPNKQSGRTFLYDMNIVVTVRSDQEKDIEKMIADRDALINDRVRTIIAESDPEKLGGGEEPGLETLRRQVKYQLDEIFGDGIINEVLVPRCIPFRTDY